MSYMSTETLIVHSHNTIKRNKENILLNGIFLLSPDKKYIGIHSQILRISKTLVNIKEMGVNVLETHKQSRISI